MQRRNVCSCHDFWKSWKKKQRPPLEWSHLPLPPSLNLSIAFHIINRLPHWYVWRRASIFFNSQISDPIIKSFPAPTASNLFNAVGMPPPSPHISTPWPIFSQKTRKVEQHKCVRRTPGYYQEKYHEKMERGWKLIEEILFEIVNLGWSLPFLQRSIWIGFGRRRASVEMKKRISHEWQTIRRNWIVFS